MPATKNRVVAKKFIQASTPDEQNKEKSDKNTYIEIDHKEFDVEDFDFIDYLHKNGRVEEIDINDFFRENGQLPLKKLEEKKNGERLVSYKVVGFTDSPIKSGYCENIQIKNMIYEKDVEKKKEEIKLFYDNIGPKLKKIRQKAKVKQGDIADALGVASSHISLWENGKGKIPTHAICVYCDLCGVSPEYILDYQKSFNADVHSNKKMIVQDLPKEMSLEDSEITEFLKSKGYIVKAPENVQKDNIPTLVKNEFFASETILKTLARYSYPQQGAVKEFILQLIDDLKVGIIMPDIVECKRVVMDELGKNREFIIKFSHPEYTAFYSSWNNAKSKIRKKLQENGVNYSEEFWDTI